MGRRAHILIFTGIMIGYMIAMADGALSDKQDSVKNAQIAYGQCELWGAAGLQKIIYPPGKRPDGFEDMKERCWVNTGRIDQDTVDYYSMIGVEMDVAE